MEHTHTRLYIPFIPFCHVILIILLGNPARNHLPPPWSVRPGRWAVIYLLLKRETMSAAGSRVGRKDREEGASHNTFYTFILCSVIVTLQLFCFVRRTVSRHFRRHGLPIASEPALSQYRSPPSPHDHVNARLVSGLKRRNIFPENPKRFSGHGPPATDSPTTCCPRGTRGVGSYANEKYDFRRR